MSTSSLEPQKPQRTPALIHQLLDEIWRDIPHLLVNKDAEFRMVSAFAMGCQEHIGLCIYGTGGDDDFRFSISSIAGGPCGQDFIDFMNANRDKWVARFHWGEQPNYYEFKDDNRPRVVWSISLSPDGEGVVHVGDSNNDTVWCLQMIVY